MNKNIRLTNESIIHDGITLYRIEAIYDFNDITKGTIGGYVQSMDNIGDNGWVGGNAKVFGKAKVYGNARVFSNSQVFGDARVYGDSEVYGDAKVYDHAKVYGNAKLYGNSEIYGNTKVFGITNVNGNAIIDNNALITSTDDYCAFQSFGSANRTTTFYKTQDGGVGVKCGCFLGTLDEFKEQVIKTHGDNEYAKEYLAIIEVVKIKFRLIS